MPDRESVLIFSSVGFIKQSVTVGNQTTINIEMNPDVTQLEELVVIGYGIRKKIDLTGAISSINEEDMKVTTAILSR